MSKHTQRRRAQYYRQRLNAGLAIGRLQRDVNKIASAVGKSYATAQVTSSQFAGRAPEVVYSLYIDGYGFHNGSSPEQALQRLRDRIGEGKGAKTEEITDVPYEDEAEDLPF